MINVDERFKDASPVDTVNRIKAIFADNGLEVAEAGFDSKVKNCHSCRVTVVGTNFGTNGKGVTKELASASAHAELMERIQAGIMCRGNLSFPDAVKMDRKMLIENCSEFYRRIGAVIQQFSQVHVSEEEMADVTLAYDGSEFTETLPFYSVTEDKMVYVPNVLMMPLFSSTGNCAGNTPEEAIVQGVSEIVERWFQRHFLCLDLVPPTISEEVLQNYPRAYESILDIRRRGYDVIIKDCSMGSGYPVIATAILDKNKHTYHVHMGASPVFEIALGRSLTESFQGRMIDHIADTSLSESAKTDKRAYRKAYKVGSGSYPIEFFTNNSSSPFVPFPDRTGFTNKDLLKYVVDFIKERNMHMYIRDMSHMGFCSYKVIVPDMCKEDCDFITSELGVSYLIGNTSQAELDLQNATADQLFELQLLNLHKLNNYMVDKDPRCSKLMQLPIADTASQDRAAALAHMAYIEWECGNKRLAMDYAAMIQAQREYYISDFFSCFIRANALKNTYKSLEDLCDRLSMFYQEDVVAQVKKVMEENTNPFAAFVVRCTRENGCDGCYYLKACYVKQQRALMEMVNGHIAKFDHQGAFEKLKTMFCKA